MGLLENLGLSGVIVKYQPEIIFQNHYQQHLEYLQQHSPVCIHLNCPICLEKEKKTQERKIEQDKIIAEKQLVYKNRCEDYMKKFRERKFNGKNIS